MNQKFLIILCAIILYNGVTYSSPANEQISDKSVHKEKQSVVSPVTSDNINEKGDSNPADTGANYTGSVILQSSTNSAITNSVTNTKIINVVNTSDVSETNATQDSVSKNINQVDDKNTSKVIDNKNSSETIEIKNATVPNTVPIGNNSSLLPISPPNRESTISPTALPVPTNTSKTMKTTIKPDTSTFVPASATSENVVVEHNRPATSDEKHFDGPSFIGGIVLTIGLTAIGFIAFKYYRSGKIDRNYRTL